MEKAHDPYLGIAVLLGVIALVTHALFIPAIKTGWSVAFQINQDVLELSRADADGDGIPDSIDGNPLNRQHTSAPVMEEVAE